MTCLLRKGSSTSKIVMDHSFTSPRRQFLKRCGLGVGSLALSDMLANQSATAGSATHHPARAEHVIHIFLNGGMSQVDTFDPKPELTRRAGQMLPFDNLQNGSGIAIAVSVQTAR